MFHRQGFRNTFRCFSQHLPTREQRTTRQNSNRRENCHLYDRLNTFHNEHTNSPERTFHIKIRVNSLGLTRGSVSKTPNLSSSKIAKGIRSILDQFTVHERKSAVEGTTKPRREYRYTWYRLLSRDTSFWQKIRCRFHFDLVFQYVRVFLVQAKNLEQHTSTKHGDPLTHYIHDHVCTYHSKKQPTNNAEHK